MHKKQLHYFALIFFHCRPVNPRTIKARSVVQSKYLAKKFPTFRSSHRQIYPDGDTPYQTPSFGWHAKAERIGSKKRMRMCQCVRERARCIDIKNSLTVVWRASLFTNIHFAHVSGHSASGVCEPCHGFHAALLYFSPGPRETGEEFVGSRGCA